MLETLIPDYAYWWVYYIFTTLLVIGISVKDQGLLTYDKGNNSYHNAVILGVIFIIFFGLRPNQGFYMADTGGYVYTYNAIKSGVMPLMDLELSTLSESLWHLLVNLMAGANLDVSLWLIAVAAIYIVFNLKGIRRVFHGQEYAAFLFYVAFFMFYSGGVNGIRNACGYSIAFWGMTFYTSTSKYKYLRMALAIFVGYLFHSSVMILVVGVIGAITLVKTTKKALIVWFAAIIISLIFGNALADYISQFATNDDRAQRYLQYAQDSELMEGFSHTGFRWDFLLFSALPIGIGYYVTVVRGIKDRFYQFMLNSYILANALWVIFIYAAFNNRYAMLSWCIYPYVIFYPFAKFRMWNNCTQNRRALLLLWVMLLFSSYV